MSEINERKWTAAQSRAISHRGSDLLVSASAGSGKTATLTARLIELLCSPRSDVLPSEVLAVTYTNAACDEMRSRLFEAALAEVTRDPSNARARRLLSSVDRVEICTIDAFCRKAIAPYFAELGLVSDFRVADDTEAEMLSERAISEVVARLFDDPERAGDLAVLADTLSSPRDETSLDSVIHSLCITLERKGADGEKLLGYADALEAAADVDLFATPIGDVIKNEIRMLASHYEPVFAHYAEVLAGVDKVGEAYVPLCTEFVGFCRVMKFAAEQTYAEAERAIASITFPRLKGVSAAAQTDQSLLFKDHRAAFKKAVEKLRSDFFGFADGEIADSLRRTAALDRALARVCSEYEKRFGELKRERGAVDFGDLERFAHRLFVTKDGKATPAALRAAEKYRFVFIDEYQDTNRVQDDIFRVIASNAERFTVGDVKQSIYSFRGADASVFSSLRRKFMDGDGGEYVFMSENFRCASNVIKYANAVSRLMFPFSDTPFDRSDELIFARGGADCPDPCEIALLSKTVEADGDAEDEYLEGASEAQYVARRVRDMISREKKADGTPITAGDIVILCRSAASKAKAFADELEKTGIPVALDAKRDMFANETTLSLVSILNAICRPELDVYFTGAMRTSPFGFSLDDVVRIRLDVPDVPICTAVDIFAQRGDGGELAEKCRRSAAILRSLRATATLVTPDVFIRDLEKTLDLETTLAVDGRSVSSVRRRIRELRTLAANAAANGFATLDSFVSYIERMMESGRGSTVSDSNADAVRIMTIHHAKGLEFPVCILAGGSGKINFKDSNEPLIFEPTLGVAAKLPDPTALVRYDTILRRVVSAIIRRRTVEEEMRVLYVAMTRAKDRFIAVASVPDADAAIENAKDGAAFLSEYSVMNASSYLGWLLAPIAGGGDCGAIAFEPSVSANAVCTRADSGEELEAPIDPDLAEKLRATFEKRFAFEYPYEYLRRVPAKLTVSRLYPEILDEEAQFETPEEANVGDIPVPRFISGGDGQANAAQIGTATHVFMQFCDHARLALEGGVEDRVCSEIERLVAERFMDRRSADLVDVSQICAFVRSPLFRRIRSARRVWREFRFNAARPAHMFTADPDLSEKLRASETDVIVQGVVDLMFEDENGRFVLVDYKTDRLTDYERSHPEAGKKTLLDRHRDQLVYYRDILGEMAPAPIDETLIYSLTLADTVAVK